MRKIRFLDRYFIFSAKHVFCPNGPLEGAFEGEKIENHHIGDYRHIDMFSRTESHRKIDSARLENHKRSFKPSKWGEDLPFER